ncbi:MAG: hypothetical protein IKQ70_01635 [Bacteroidales bacterium]|nr:hypothetical protein [Alphaproteobacteria bacterium]MBR6176569.1 hypothetical protein [Bacteroidales bacterium]
MNDNKSSFQEISIALENLLKDYQKQYPKTMGDVFMNNYAFWVLLISVGLSCVFYFGTQLIEYKIMIYESLFFSGTLIIKTKRKKISSTLLPQIEQLKQQIEPFAEYPDVKNYLKEFDIELNETIKNKQKYIRIHRICFISLMLVFVFTISVILYLP